MLLTITLLALGTVTVGSVVVYQRGARRRLLAGDAPRATLPPARAEREEVRELGLDELRPGDVIVEGDDDWLIVGTLTYQEERDRWHLHRVQGDGSERWLEARPRDGLVAAWFEPATDIPSFGTLYDGLTHRGLPFRLVRRGDARVQVSGDVDGRVAGLVRYSTYEGPGGMYLNVEEPEGGERLSYSGERVVAEGLMLMPGERPQPDAPTDEDDAL